MYLYGAALLHVVDEGKKVNAASFIVIKSSKTIWNTFLKCWAMIYTGLPNTILTDQRTEFFQLFIDTASESNVLV